MHVIDEHAIRDSQGRYIYPMPGSAFSREGQPNKIFCGCGIGGAGRTQQEALADLWNNHPIQTTIT